LADEHVAQILGYLRSSGGEHGLLINFGTPKFEIKKHALSRVGEASHPGGLIGGTLSLFASLALFLGLCCTARPPMTLLPSRMVWWGLVNGLPRTAVLIQSLNWQISTWISSPA
jgi:hypothetical protein